MQGKLKKGESTFRCTDAGLLCGKWQDMKEVLVMTHYHKHELVKIKKNKEGQQQEIGCPEVGALYKQKIDGVDHADQFICLCNHNRKITKWCRKVFYT